MIQTDACHGPLALQSADGSLRAMACLRCGYVHLSPKPSAGDMARFWRDAYGGRTDPPLLEQEDHPSYWRLVHLERLRRMRGHCPEGWRLLDYGAGLGRFVWTALGLGFDWETWGYEPNLRPKDDGLLRIYRGWSDIEQAAGVTKFNAVHCSLVLEHLADPLAALRDISKVMAPGGVLCVVVPNEFNHLQVELMTKTSRVVKDAMGERLVAGYTPICANHANYFTPETLRRLAGEAGFSVVEVLSTFPMEWLALHGLNYYKDPRLGDVAHRLRVAFETALMKAAPGALRRLRRRWAEKGIGREVELWLRKT